MLRLDNHGYSPAVLQQIVTAGARLHPFADAAFALSLTGLSISPRHIQELTGQIGAELAAVRNRKAQQRRKRHLQPEVATTPAVVAAEIDGGRLRTRASGGGPGVHQPQNKEEKLACLVTLDSQEYAVDPQPEPPPSFLQPRRVQRLVQQMAGLAGEEPAAEATPSTDLSEEETPGLPQDEPWAPQRLVRTCLASMEKSLALGPLVAGEAQARNFYAAPRRAFVADGLAHNWTIQRGYFPDFVPIVDFLHVLCYLFTAAQALAEPSQRWAQYESWFRACWQGRVAEVVQELQQRQQAVGRAPPGAEVAATDPRRVLAETLSYLSNNAERMQYPEYRRQGLPTTSSLVESLVGVFNARVKGKTKFGNRPGGAEAILQLRAALLSEDGRLAQHFATRPGNPYRRRQAA